MEIRIYMAILAQDKLQLSPPAIPYTAYTDVRALDREHKFVRDNTILNSQTRNSRPLGGTDSPRNLYPGTKSLRRRGCLASSVDTSGDDAEPEHLANIHR